MRRLPTGAALCLFCLLGTAAEYQWVCVPGEPGRWRCGHDEQALDASPLAAADSATEPIFVAADSPYSKPRLPWQPSAEDISQPTPTRDPPPQARRPQAADSTAPFQGRFALRLVSVSTPLDVRAFAEDFQIDTQLVRYTRVTEDDSERFLIVYGGFKSARQARMAITALPVSIRSIQPKPVAIRSFKNPLETLPKLASDADPQGPLLAANDIRNNPNAIGEDQNGPGDLDLAVDQQPREARPKTEQAVVELATSPEADPVAPLESSADHLKDAASNPTPTKTASTSTPIDQQTEDAPTQDRAPALVIQQHPEQVVEETGLAIEDPAVVARTDWPEPDPVAPLELSADHLNASASNPTPTKTASTSTPIDQQTEDAPTQDRAPAPVIQHVPEPAAVEETGLPIENPAVVAPTNWPELAANAQTVLSTESGEDSERSIAFNPPSVASTTALSDDRVQDTVSQEPTPTEPMTQHREATASREVEASKLDLEDIELANLPAEPVVPAPVVTVRGEKSKQTTASNPSPPLTTPAAPEAQQQNTATRVSKRTETAPTIEPAAATAIKTSVSQSPQQQLEAMQSPNPVPGPSVATDKPAFESIDSSYFTLQLSNQKTEDSALRFIVRHGLDRNRVHQVLIDEGAGPRWLILYAQFPDLEAAEAAKHLIPQGIRRPWARRVAPLQRDMIRSK